jgi:hypothetical protein
VDYVDHQMSDADLGAVASVDTTLNVLSDFTSDRQALKTALAHFTAVDGVAFDTPADGNGRHRRGRAGRPPQREYDLFNNDARLRAIRTLTEALAPIEQKKAILYFSNGHVAQRQRQPGGAAHRRSAPPYGPTVSLYPVDARGLQAVVPGGDARGPAPTGVNAFSGRGRAGTVRSAGRIAGNTADIWRPTPAAVRSPTATSWATPSCRCSATRRLLPAGLQLHQRRQGRRFRRITCG